MSDTPNPSAVQDAVQVAFESISDLYKIVEKLEAAIEQQAEEIAALRSKAGRVA
ncbi:MAG TPA: hypothetical protein VN734_14170 [Acidobacteriaceae bacterium]|nr:hypothetical protein [Acidobacteriaceae bacterium]